MACRHPPPLSALSSLFLGRDGKMNFVQFSQEIGFEDVHRRTKHNLRTERVDRRVGTESASLNIDSKCGRTQNAVWSYANDT